MPQVQEAATVLFASLDELSDKASGTLNDDTSRRFALTVLIFLHALIALHGLKKEQQKQQALQVTCAQNCWVVMVFFLSLFSPLSLSATPMQLAFSPSERIFALSHTHYQFNQTKGANTEVSSELHLDLSTNLNMVPSTALKTDASSGLNSQYGKASQHRKASQHGTENQRATLNPQSRRFSPNSSIFTHQNRQSWHQKMQYFVNVHREWRAMQVSRETDNSAIASSELDVDYQTSLASLTMGGYLLPRTHLYWDITSEHYTLAGDLINTGITGVENTSPVRFERYKLLFEWFAETDLSRGWSLGLDSYHSRSRYRDAVVGEVFTDKEYGASFLVSKKFMLPRAQWRIDYILSHRLLEPGDNNFERETRTFHNLVLAYQHRWHFQWHSQLTLRGSYYPVVDHSSFWEASQVYAANAEVNYFPQAGHQFTVKAEHIWLGTTDTFSILALNYEYQFGVSKTKRRKRHRRIPQLLIR